MPDIDVDAVRKRAWAYLSPDVAAVGHMRLDQLQQFAIGTYTPDKESVAALARRMNLHDRV